MKKVNKRCIERELQKALALEFVKEFCKQKGYSLEKLSCQKFSIRVYVRTAKMKTEYYFFNDRERTVFMVLSCCENSAFSL